MELSTDIRIHGLLGMVLGFVSILVVLIGSASQVDEFIKKTAGVLIGHVSLLSVAITVMIFAMSATEYLYSLRHIFATTSLLLALLLLCLGYLVSSSTPSVSSVLCVVMAAGIAFSTGFVFGSLAMPFSRSEVLSMATGQGVMLNGEPLYRVFPQVFPFMCQVMLTTAVLFRAALDSSCKLNSIVGYFSRIVSP